MIICCFFLLPVSPKRLSSVRLFASGSDVSRYISSLYFAVKAGKLFWQEDGMCFGGSSCCQSFVLGVRLIEGVAVLEVSLDSSIPIQR